MTPRKGCLERMDNRELDRQIHERVYGKMYPRIMININRTTGEFSRRTVVNAPSFSSDMDYAMRAVREATAPDRLLLGLNCIDGLWGASVGTPEKGAGHGDGNTAPEAICMAVLDFVGA